MQTTNKNDTKPKSRIWPTLITLTIIAIAVAIAISFLPRSIPTDFSVVGKGTNALVLMYDPNLAQSTQTASAMNAVRDEHEGHIKFVIAKTNGPTGRMLRQRYNVQSLALIFFSGDGNLLHVVYSPQDGDSLRQHLNNVFKLEKVANP